MSWTRLVDATKKHWTKIAYAAPIVVSFVVGVSLRLGDGLSFSGEHVLWPINAYVTTSTNQGDSESASHLKLSSDYLDAFWTEFPRYYFTESREGEFGKLFFLEEKEQSRRKQSGVKLKFLFQNDSRGDPLVISTIEAKVKLTEKSEFPWRKLEDFRPELQVVESNFGRVEISGNWVPVAASIKVKNDFGPALESVCEVEAPNGRLQADPDVQYSKNLHKDEFIQFGFSIRNENSIYNPWDTDSIEVDAQGKLPECFFFNLAYSETKPENPDVIWEKNGDSYEEIQTLERLRQVAEIWHKERVRITCSYYSLNGKKTDSESFEGTVLQDRAAYPNKGELTKQKGCRGPDDDDSQDPVAEAGGVFQAAADQATSMLPGYSEGAQPAGVDLITSEIELDLRGLVVDRRRAALKNPDQILNPAGHVIVYLTLKNLENGEYSVAIGLNEVEMRKMTFETLVPDEYSFNYPASLEHFSFDLGKISSAANEDR